MEKKEMPRENKGSEFMEWVKSFALAIVIALVIRMFLFEFVIVKQTSMYPTLVAEQRLGLLKCAYWFDEPEYGDIVVIKISSEKDYVKRVIATGGQSIEIKDSRVYIDGNLLEESYISNDLFYPDCGPYSVPEGYIFVLGDNRPSSVDSRSLGMIDLHKVKGRVVFRIKPFDFF